MIEASALGALTHVRHGFFGRKGGVSTGIFASLNCGLGSGDDDAAVQENRTRAMHRLSRKEKELLTLYQIHSAQVVEVREAWTRATRPRADAMVTTRPELVLGILAADCAPVLFADRSSPVIGAAHAGWKGALTGVTEATVAAMERLGSRRKNIVAAIGPCIGPAAYEVGAEFGARFLEATPTHVDYFRPGERASHFYFDLPRFVKDRVVAAGVGTVEVIANCTYAQHEDYFSYRRATHAKEPDYGRNLSAITLNP